MEGLRATVASSPLYPLFAIAGIIVIVIGVVTYAAVLAREHAGRNVAKLVQDLAAVQSKLMEAEKIGRFGSFTWDFINPDDSLWSEEMFELFGRLPRPKAPAIDTMIGWVHVKDKSRAQEEWDRARAQSGDFSFMFRSVGSSGKVRYLQVEGKTTYGPNHDLQRIQGVAHDVSKEVEIDRAKTEFVSLASHQLKTPLTSIKWLSEGLLSGKDEKLSPNQEKYVHEIHAASQRMVEMVNDLLNVSRIELGTLAVRIEELDVGELSRGVLAEQQHTADEKSVVVTLTCDSALPHIGADKNLIRMVFQNLISNAIKYTPTGGTVTCEISLGGVLRDGLFIQVSDTGIGIPKEEQQNVFKKLHRASNAEALVPDGTGLGLYVIKTIVDKVGGSISFESKEGKGTTFYVSLPLKWLPGDSAADMRD